ncbi:PDZ domain-containing protein [Botrimarina sp.]|uniref:S1C family serine protease n=1 Tax=Botrimarina sp. TaxID=2795802 RepID=UPI0032EE3292
MRIFGLLAVAAAAVAAVQIAIPTVRAQNAGSDDEGVVINIGPDEGVGVDVDRGGGVDVEVDPATTPEDRRERRLDRRQDRRERLGRIGGGPVAVSRYWIGLGGSPVPEELRAQIAIDGDHGVLVRTVAPDGPAAQAGLQQYDIILRANGEPIEDLAELAEIVGEQGENGGQIAIDLLRRGQQKTITVEPIERPLDAQATAPARGWDRRGLLGRDGPGVQLNLDDLLGQAESLLEDRAFRGMEGLGELGPQVAASGVSISVARQGAGPAKVTVQRGDQSWEFDEGDQQAIDALPADVRPTVERMLQQNGGAFEPGFEGFHLDAPGVELNLRGEGIAERIRAMQERMRLLQERFGAGVGGGFGGFDEPAPGGAVEQPEIEIDEAPAFDGGAEPDGADEAEGPIEIEIPAEEVPAES